jgi:hypothetical protein
VRLSYTVAMRLFFALIATAALTLWLGANYWRVHQAGGMAADEPLGMISGEALDPLAGAGLGLTPPDLGGPAVNWQPRSQAGGPIAGQDGASNPSAGATPSGLDPAALAGLGARQLDHIPISDMKIDAPELEPGVKLLSFSDLYLPDYEDNPSFDGEERPASDEIFPPEILALNGQKVALDGFMEPLDFRNRQVIAFVLSPLPPGCCFGAIPRMDEYIEAIVMDEKGLPYYGARPIRAVGHLEVGEIVDEYGYVTSVYRLDVERVDKLW